MCYIYIYIYARERYFTLREGYAINSQKWRDVEDIILNKIIQTQEYKCVIVSPAWEF